MNKTIDKLNIENRMGSWGTLISTYLSFALVFVGTELMLHILVFGMPGPRIIYPILFELCLSGICTAICVMFPPKVQKILGIILTVIFVVWALTQYIYQEVFGSFMPVNQLLLGGNVADFRSQLMYCLRHNILQIILLLLPFFAYLLMLICKKILHTRLNWKQLLVSIAASVLAVASAFLLMFATRNAPASVYQLFFSPNTVTTVSYSTVGIAATTVQEIRFMFSSQADPDTNDIPLPEPGNIEIDDTDNALPIDFNALAKSTDDPDLKRLDLVTSNLTPTKKNEYTGLLKGGNVIMICAESFSPHFISEELTPTLYKLTHNGFIFNNFYGSFKNMTTNGEYTFCTGLFPDLSRKKVDSSFDESIGHYLPYCLGNALKNNGYLTYAYHNYVGEFYNRNLTHPNMGYNFISTSNGLEVTMQWPASDLEMIEQTVDDYIGKHLPFAVHYMTFSGHYQYDWYNAMSAKHKDRVKDMPYSDTVKAFIACNLEVEDALTYLLDRLKQEGLMEKTLIVLTNDHYPYGLKEDEYNELAGYPVDTDFEKYRNSFICYTEAIEEPVIVDDYCCTADILPTILNLIGYDYDSRLLAGVDVLSDAPHMAILDTGSFITNEFRYNADTGIATSNDGEGVIPDDEVQKWLDLATQRLEFSREVLNCDYYAHVFGQSGNVNFIDDVVNFSDVKKIFTQASVSWVVSKGFMDPISETKFGVKRHQSLGELIDSMYRISGRPDVSPEALPKGYTDKYIGVNEEKLTDDHPYFNAMCWAFEQKLIRDGDRVQGFGESVTYIDIALLLCRLCRLNDVEIQIATGDESLDELMARLVETYPQYTTEELEAMAWCFSEHIIALSYDLDEQIEIANKIASRQRVVTYLFRTCTFELNMN